MCAVHKNFQTRLRPIFIWRDIALYQATFPFFKILGIIIKNYLSHICNNVANKKFSSPKVILNPGLENRKIISRCD